MTMRLWLRLTQRAMYEECEGKSMKHNAISIWWDGEGDFLSVTLAEGDGDMVHTKDGKAMVKVGEQGEVLGFHILGVSKKSKQAPFRFELVPEVEENAV